MRNNNFKMKFFIVLAAVALSARGEFSSTAIRLTWGLGDATANDSHYFILPMTEDEAKASSDWAPVARNGAGDLIPELETFYCTEDCAICIIYETKNGNLVAIQMAVPEDDFTPGPMPAEEIFYKWVGPASDGKSEITYLAVMQWLATEEDLKSGTWPGDRKSLLNSGARVVDLEKKIVVMPYEESEITKTTLFTRQNCVTSMGTHYFYNMSSTMECDKLMPWFILTSGGERVGSGFQTYGKLSKKSKYWSEGPPTDKFGLSIFIGDAPSCLYDMAGEYGLISLHIYYIDEPWAITCDYAKDSLVPLEGVKKTVVDALFSAGGTFDFLQSLFG